MKLILSILRILRILLVELGEDLADALLSVLVAFFAHENVGLVERRPDLDPGVHHHYVLPFPLTLQNSVDFLKK